MDDAFKQLLVAALAGDASRVRDGDSERDLHAEDISFHAPRRPDLVVYPTSAAEVAAVLALANDHEIAVTPFGAGSSLEGHVIPQRGGISLDLTRMDRIVAVRPDDLQAVVEAGVTRGALGRAAGQHGLWFPVDPGADATLGGMAATNAAGTTTLRFGKMRAQVLALEAVLADGSVIRTGSAAAKTSAGYDLTGLLVGSEGTLAVITELTLRLQGIPDRTVAARLSFDDLESACRVAIGAVAAGQAIHRLELLDALTIGQVNAYQGTAFPVAPCLFVEAAGQSSAVDEELGLGARASTQRRRHGDPRRRGRRRPRDPLARSPRSCVRNRGRGPRAQASLDRHVRSPLAARCPRRVRPPHARGGRSGRRDHRPRR